MINLKVNLLSCRLPLLTPRFPLQNIPPTTKNLQELTDWTGNLLNLSLFKNQTAGKMFTIKLWKLKQLQDGK